MDRYLCLRFDVDTHRCIRTGVPNLLDLSARIDVPLTFFVNMGRAVSRAHLVRRLIRGAPAAPDAAEKLAARAKLGPWDALVAALLNPPVGAGSPRILDAVHAGGHELGLHGGTNHAAWQADARSWSSHRLEEEISGALGQLVAETGRRPRGFASPGWNSPEGLAPLLEELGFRYVADAHGAHRPALSRPAGCRRLLSVRTNLSGEPGGVAYLEHLRARGLDDQAIREDFRQRLGSAGRLAVLYDHPYFAGIHELSLIEELVDVATDAGFRVVALREAVSALASESV